MRFFLKQYNLSNHLFHITIFALIFILYFSSSVGLINSGDTPQYFTTEALLRNQTVDISSFKQDPHFFIWPDYVVKNGMILGQRGFMMSLISLPLHIAAQFIQHLLHVKYFPENISFSPNFRYELTVTGLFALFSVLGLVFIWKTMEEILKDKIIPGILVLLSAFGTYSWKYSIYYARRGFEVFLIGLSIYLFWKLMSSKKRKLLWLGLFAVCWSISYGIDSILFFTLSVSLFLYIISWIYKLYLQKKKNLFIKHIKSLLIYLTPSAILLSLTCLLSLYWYNNIFANIYFENIILKSHFNGNVFQTWLSTPVFPTIFYILFGFGKIHPESFIHFNQLAQEVKIYASVDYAMKYNFYGLFTISPFLLFSFFSIGLFLKKLHRNIVIFCFLMFSIGVFFNMKVFSFWGGNQYDVHYIYPYVLYLCIPTALAISYLMTRRLIIRIPAVLLIVATGIWSIYMGWFGVLNMYKPALTGERRIWIEPNQLMSLFSNYSNRQILDATFPNRENWFIAMLLAIILYFIFYRITLFLGSKK